MEFARNMFDSRSGEAEDRFESIALELELDSFQECDLDQYSDHDKPSVAVETTRPVPPKRRRVNPPFPTEDSFWWQEWLAPDKAQHLRTADPQKDPEAMDFRTHFRVPYQVFEDLVELVVRKGFYDPSQKDAVGRPCKNISLLTLACLHHLGYGYSFSCIKRCVKISRTTL